MRIVKVSHLEAKIDDEDFERIANHNWWLLKGGYAYSQTCKNGKRTTLLMHRLVTQAPKGVEVDHINGNVLDNRKANLRLCSRSQNCSHRRSFGKLKGLYWSKNAWQAQIKNDKQHVYLGRYKDKIEAARAYDKAALELFGSFANINFPNEIT